MNKPYPLCTLPEIQDLKELIESKAQKCPEKTAIEYYKKNVKYSITYQQLWDDTNALGAFLFKNVKRESHVAIHGENSYEWLVLFLALVNGGYVAVPVDKDLDGNDALALFHHADVTTAFISKSDRTLNKMLSEESYEISVRYLESITDYISEGANILSEEDNEYVSYEINKEKLTAIFFTSGTTAEPKGVMLNHKNLSFDIHSSCRNFQLKGCALSVLPFHHTLGLVVSALMVINYEYPLHICGKIRNLVKELPMCTPQTTLFVPLILESIKKKIIETAKSSGKWNRMQKAFRISNLLLTFKIDIRKKLFKDIRKVLGNNLEYIICGGAPLEVETIVFFRNIGIEVLNGYGITECSPVISVNRNHHHKDGTVGLILSDCQVNIENPDENGDGEIVFKGNNVMMGYYKNPEATNEVLIDGWYRTGDIGHIDKDGFLSVTGRLKNVIILSNGENVSPEALESIVYSIDGVTEVIVKLKDNLITAEIYTEQGNQNQIERDIFIRMKQLPINRQIQQVIFRDMPFEKTASNKIKRK